MNPHLRLRQRYAVLSLAVTVVALIVTVGSAAERAPKFYVDDPLTSEPETQDASKVAPWKIDLFYDLMLNQFTHPGEPPGLRAQNVNTIDEVPNSSWFTNRIVSRKVSIEEAVRGPAAGMGPASGTWTVIRMKSEGAAPGFTIRDSAGVTWFVAFDPKSNPEGATGAALIANKIFWTLGYNQAEYYLTKFNPEQLAVDPTAQFTPPSGRERRMRLDDIRPVLKRAAVDPDGTYRVMASRLLPGKLLGGFKYHGTRPDDPNDIVPHENRRELRALKVFAAWTNLVDLKALNTMDTLITENGRSRVRHYLLDIGSTFGMGANGPREWTEGYEYLFERDKVLKRLYTLGLYTQPWQKAKYKEYPSIGYFEGDQFDPELWKSRVPAAAAIRALDDDLFWAARRVMAFDDEMIRALVKVGRYSNPEAEKYLADVLIKRRNKIGERYLTAINPLTDFSLSGSGTFTFRNEAVRYGFAKAPEAYSADWYSFDNHTRASAPIGQSKGKGDALQLPAGAPNTPGTFLMAEVRVPDAPIGSWREPVKVYFKRDSGGWRLVGVERTIRQTQPDTKPVSDKPL